MLFRAGIELDPFYSNLTTFAHNLGVENSHRVSTTDNYRFEQNRPKGKPRSRRGDTAAFFVETPFPATTSAEVSRRPCLTRSRVRLPPAVATSRPEPQSLGLSAP